MVEAGCEEIVVPRTWQDISHPVKHYTTRNKKSNPMRNQFSNLTQDSTGVSDKTPVYLGFKLVKMAQNRFLGY